MILDPILDLFRGKALTIPPLDGAYRPNRRLDEAPVFAGLAEVDNLTALNGRILASSGNAVYALEEGREPQPVQSFTAAITAMAASPAGQLAVALTTGQLFMDGALQTLPAAVTCISALAFAADGSLWLANGSADHAMENWSADLMRHGATGSIWLRPADAAQFVQKAAGLAFPYGLLPIGADVVFSESWRHRLVRLDADTGARSVLVDHLPGYPARLAANAEGGAWLSFFAPRNRLIEFVLQERHYRNDMMEQVPSQFWIAPALSSGRSFLEPLQCGGIKTMGVHKPWSPSRSYGLVACLDAQFQPLYSLHSRANGQRHGTCSAIAVGSDLLVASRGGDCVLRLGNLDRQGV